MSERNLLGEYLRARRELVKPESVGLPAGASRRVPGLRREKVAMLAGISSDYYLRLEQGRDVHPSAQVLEALARVLQLDDAAADYLLELAAPQPRHRRRRARRETVPDGIRQLLDVLGLPAFVEGRYFDILASNPLARALSPSLRPGQNRLTSMFLDPAEKALHPDWDRDTARLVAGFRESVGADTDDPRFVRLVGELSQSSRRFRQLWPGTISVPRRACRLAFTIPSSGSSRSAGRSSRQRHQGPDARSSATPPRHELLRGVPPSIVVDVNLVVFAEVVMGTVDSQSINCQRVERGGFGPLAVTTIMTGRRSWIDASARLMAAMACPLLRKE